MPYMALQCFSCHVMQVKEVRKSPSSNKKWSCVLCNEKQSVRKVYKQADTAKEVRNFVQKYNLTMGQAAEAEGRTRLEVECTREDSPFNYRYEEDEDGQGKTVGRDDYAAQKNSYKWDKFLPEEEQGCPEEEFQQSSDDLKFTTTIPEPPSRRRTRPQSSSPPPERPSRGFTTPADDAEPGSFNPSASKKVATHTARPSNSLQYQQDNDSGYEDNTLGNPTRKLANLPESTSSSLPTLDFEYSPKKVKSCHAQTSEIQTSKWSKYLT